LSPTPFHGNEDLVEHGVMNHADLHNSIFFKRNAHTKTRKSMRVVCGSVERINNPAARMRFGFSKVAFFCKDGIFFEAFFDFSNDCLLSALIDFGHKVNASLFPNVDFLFKVF
jgi:hypothetical protein